ncbi:hypothetical protein GCM10009661_48010 [Catellatospora chokoriensis]|uniref:Uncharacterized protein n=2 Tax=Catellatospora chokoriensis TaxID=310353 RepID=A0A8J3JWW3_9ACTN|nr:hypothetical protein Cch02nite_60150 [Catellatospora chokoriensis]
MHAVGEAPAQLLTAITQLCRRLAPASIIEHLFEQMQGTGLDPPVLDPFG